MGWEDTRAFLAKVVPWPGDQTPGYINLHWQVKREDGGSYWLGSPHLTVDDAVNKASWLVSNGMVDVFYCLSLQSATKQNSKGKTVAHRDAKNAVALKAFWLDLDVKEGAYASIEEAVAAANEFCTRHNLPRYNAAVGSGGGLHVYWVLDAPISKAEWQPIADGFKRAVLADGLKCDTQCTGNSAQILRVPETFNTKLAMRRPVKLFRLTDDIPLDAVKHLAAGVLGGQGAANKATALFPVRSSPAFEMEVGDEGVEKRNLVPDPRLVFRECPLLHAVFENGGADCGQPLWNLTTLAATFFPNGRGFAHALAKGHRDYGDGKPTDALYDRKDREKAEKGLGWPSCSAFEAAGSTHCGGCPHRAAAKTPLHLGVMGFAQSGSGGSNGLDLPPGYGLDSDGRMCIYVGKSKKVKQPDGTTVKEEYNDLVPLFLNRGWTDAWAQKGGAENDDVIHFVIEAEKGHYRQCSITYLSLMEGGWTQTPGMGLIPTTMGFKHGRDFFLSWMKKLWETKPVVQARAFGWSRDKRSFAFGGAEYKKEAPPVPGGRINPEIGRYYTPCGIEAPWFKAAKWVTDQNRPDMEILLATTFAAPLLVFSGQEGCMLSAWGKGGDGKTTTRLIAQAVWAHPKLGGDTLETTDKSIVSKMGHLCHLPLYWDEIRDQNAQTKVYRAIGPLTQGMQPGKMKDGERRQEKSEWQTMLMIMSNRSFFDYLAKENKQTSAWFYRVIEYKVTPVPAAMKKQWNSTKMEKYVTGDLFDNYGKVGERYAQLLADNAPTLLDRLLAIQEAFDRDAKVADPNVERMWSVFCSCILLAVELANELGCEFHYAPIREFLIKVMGDMRKRLAGFSYESDEGTEDILSQFLKSQRRNTILTDICTVLNRHTRVNLYNPQPPHLRENGKYVTVHYVYNPSIVRISKSTLRDWVYEAGYNPSSFFEGLARLYNLQEAGQVTLGAGTDYAIGRERVYDLEIHPGSMLEEAREAVKGQAPVISLGSNVIPLQTGTAAHP